MTPLLFSVDLEGTARVPELTERLLDLLGRRDARATFFVLGTVAREHPDLVRKIAGEGHEIACHSYAHVTLDRQNEAAFTEDLERALGALADAGVPRPEGYRAPCFSLTDETKWAYPVLERFGFAWSSSVLAARNPLHGWPGFGTAPRRIGGVLEMPVTLMRVGLLKVPIGGVYLRALPWPLVRSALARRRKRAEAVLTYVHPYDLDSAGGDEDFGFGRFSPYGLLMRLGRRGLPERLERLLGFGFAPITYGAYARGLEERLHRGDE